MSKNIKLAIVIIISLYTSAYAHRPIFTDQKGTDAKTAVKITDPNISQVIYRPLTDKTPQLWLTINAEKDFELFVQIGIPAIERQKLFRPSFVILGPGLEKISMPFDTPKVIGGKDFPTTEIEKPEFFHERFTKTDSWILRSEKLNLPATGKYYIVAYSPLNEKGKLWISVGQKENFGFLDIFRFPGWKKNIRNYHETDLQQKTKPKSHSKRFPRKLPGHKR